MSDGEKDMKAIMEKVNECLVEYGLKVNTQMSHILNIVPIKYRSNWNDKNALFL